MNNNNSSNTDNQAQSHGIQCPKCQHLISVTLPTLLAGTVYCSACGLKLTVDQSKSKESMQALHTLWQTMQRCETTPGETLPAGSVSTRLKGK
ncbi:MAG: hypothetical protein PVJ72_18540 [Gammaproteobacteria bacterium]|jgi:uncharacterized paraquat-inducible protein A